MINSLTRNAFLFALLAACVAGAAAQSGKCSLRIQQVNPAPELLGLHLGMTAADVKAWEPAVLIPPPDKLGLSETSMSPDFVPKIDKVKYANVRTISFQFLDGTLYSFWIGYTDGFKWNTEMDFLPKMSGALGLIAEGWERKGLGKVQNCDGLQAQFNMIARGPSIRLTDTAAKDIYDQRRATAEAAKPAEPEEP